MSEHSLHDFCRAVELASILHAGQKDQSGYPYIYHPLRIASELETDGYGYTHMIAAALHDVVEDTEWTIEDISNVFDSDIADIVDHLTRRDGESYRDFILRTTTHPVSFVVKQYDVADNLQRIPQLVVTNPRKAVTLQQRYTDATNLMKNEGR